ncbi:hypothetical protein [Amycolatopsis speibonae]|uniref:Uncharacterized protein n=1 Tax=Amycolatopsis speibonae TaxID=1450224 RepID=A0ABV7PF46_9PSEU
MLTAHNILTLIGYALRHCYADEDAEPELASLAWMALALNEHLGTQSEISEPVPIWGRGSMANRMHAARGSLFGGLGEDCMNVDLSEAPRTVLADVVPQNPLHLNVRGEGSRLRTLDGQNDEGQSHEPLRAAGSGSA